MGNSKLARLALEHRKFLHNRTEARKQGVFYPQTRGTLAVNKGSAAPEPQGGLTGFLGMGARHADTGRASTAPTPFKSKIKPSSYKDQQSALPFSEQKRNQKRPKR